MTLQVVAPAFGQDPDGLLRVTASYAKAAVLYADALSIEFWPNAVLWPDAVANRSQIPGVVGELVALADVGLVNNVPRGSRNYGWLRGLAVEAADSADRKGRRTSGGRLPPMWVPDGHIPLIPERFPVPVLVSSALEPPAELRPLLEQSPPDAEAVASEFSRFLGLVSGRVAPPATPALRKDLAEVALAGRLLGELPAFPHADVRDVLDVRERLTDARTRFRSVMAAAGRALADVPPEEFEVEVARYRREHVDDALLSIREQLEDLGAIPTLLRALREKWAVPTVASLAVATTVLDVSSAAAAAATAAGVSLGAREALARREVRRQARQQAYWYLSEVERALAH